MDMDNELHIKSTEGILPEKSNAAHLDPNRDNPKTTKNDKENMILKRCHYYKDSQCIKNKKQFDLCNNCPYGYISCFENIVGSIFQRTIGMAIGILNMENAINFIRRKK